MGRRGWGGMLTVGGSINEHILDQSVHLRCMCVAGQQAGERRKLSVMTFRN